MSGDEESNARNAQAFVVLEGKPCCVSHLQSNLQIHETYFSYAPINVLIICGILPSVFAMSFWVSHQKQRQQLQKQTSGTTSNSKERNINKIKWQLTD